MQLFLKILSGMANSVDPHQTAPRSSLIWVCTVCMCHFVRNFGVRIFRTFTVYYIPNLSKISDEIEILMQRVFDPSQPYSESAPAKLEVFCPPIQKEATPAETKNTSYLML